MTTRLALLITFAAAVLPAADPAGLACPIPRAIHPPSSDASLRAAREDSRRPPDCCGVVINKLKYSAPGVICWPVLVGDTIQAQGWPTAVVLNDGARIYLSEGSRVQVDLTTISILSGTLFWKIPPASKRRIAALDKPPVTFLQGMAQLRDQKLIVNADMPLPGIVPDIAELIRRFPDASGRLIPSDGP